MIRKLSITLAVLLSISCGDNPEVQEEVVRPVRYTKIESLTGGDTRVFTGLAQPGVESKLSFKVPGTIATLNAKIGQEVQKGSIIAILDDSDYLLQYEEADAAVKNADAFEKSTKSNYERISILYENQNVSLAEFESAKASFNSAKAQEKAVKQRRKLAEAQLSYTRLRSPIAGVISEVRIEENENIQAGQLVVIVTSDEQLEVEVSVPDLYISEIELGDEVEVVFSAFRDDKYRGQVTEVGFAAGFQTTYPVILTLTKSDTKVRPGMSAEVLFKLGSKQAEPKIYVPGSSVGEDRDGRFVYSVAKTEQGYGTVLRKPVVVGDVSEGGVEIIEGVSNGDLIVTAGVSKISEGIKVKLMN
ncbi:MAG: efflux RND transporter periplasmic adaptor subunit [Saprospiraceae bacterium]|nr:efflux RND transporter periplasmic adaptor subunit [Saprospiraceae bacterium]